jgi:HD-like signal output (HDOD) protein
MRKLLSRIFSQSDDKVAGSDGAARDNDAGDAGGPASRIAVEIDMAFYRWLTASAAYNAPPEIEEQILDQIGNLSHAPSDAAGLVPRVPEIIPQLLKSLREDDVSPAELAQQIAGDVVLVAEVIREANSSYYRPLTPINTIEAAIMMLGQNGLRVLLARLAFRPIIQMQPNGFARRAAANVWSQSEKCALAASLMAPGLTAGVFESYLAGLMLNVGVMVAFRIADSVCQNDKIPRSSEFGAKLLACSRQLSARVAAHWEFPPEVVAAIADADAPGESKIAQALALGDRIAKLRLLIDNFVLLPDDPMVAGGLDPFQRRCLGKLSNLDG